MRAPGRNCQMGMTYGNAREREKLVVKSVFPVRTFEDKTVPTPLTFSVLWHFEACELPRGCAHRMNLHPPAVKRSSILGGQLRQQLLDDKCVGGFCSRF